MTKPTLPVFVFAAALLLAIGPSPTDSKAVSAAVEKVFAPFKSKSNTKGAWEFPIYSVRTRQLINQWQRATADLDIDPVIDADWLCRCQDWDEKAFRIKRQMLTSLGPNKVQALVTFTQGWGESDTTRFIFVRENGRWEVDDLFFEKGHVGLRADLRQSITDAAKSQSK